MAVSPNPFNDAALIEISVPKNERIDVNIVDLAGRCVSRIYSGKATPGILKLRWAPGDIPAGVYFAVVRSENSSAATKILYIK